MVSLILSELSLVAASTAWFPITGALVVLGQLSLLILHPQANALLPLAVGALAILAILARGGYLLGAVLSSTHLLLAAELRSTMGPHGLLVDPLAVSALLVPCWVIGIVISRHTRAERSRLLAQQDLAIRRERASLANSLHDTIGSTNARLYWQATELLSAAPCGAPYADQVRSIQELARQNADGVHAMLTALTVTGASGDELDDGDCTVADYLESRREALAGRGIQTEVRVDPALATLERPVCAAVMKVCREATANTARHGRGPCTIAVTRVPQAQMVEVFTVNARHLPGAEPRSIGGSGLTTLREMVDALGGTLDYGVLGYDPDTWYLRARLPERVGHV